MARLGSRTPRVTVTPAGGSVPAFLPGKALPCLQARLPLSHRALSPRLTRLRRPHSSCDSRAPRVCPSIAELSPNPGSSLTPHFQVCPVSQPSLEQLPRLCPRSEPGWALLLLSDSQEATSTLQVLRAACPTGVGIPGALRALGISAHVPGTRPQEHSPVPRLSSALPLPSLPVALRRMQAGLLRFWAA